MEITGATLGPAALACVAVHGRDQDPGYMAEHLVTPVGLPDVAWVLPAADGGSWYPGRFDDPREANEPWLSRALAEIDAALAHVAAAGVPFGRTVLAGFSQGACLVADHVARRPAPYAGIAVLTGALIGAPGDVPPVAPLGGLPVLMATARDDEWVPLEYVEMTARAFEAAGGSVELVIDEAPEHAISPAAAAAVRTLFERARPA
ncbi:MAG: phospholipase/carboxylesterase [Solirubrobacteraceae bacterium]|jgi:phospholipase/carboxylesterase|nr:phospholipase/carboxylesterase [Solirubrobacteraceae bacterium]